jgi:peptidoglycan-associated lipoprotein
MTHRNSFGLVLLMIAINACSDEKKPPVAPPTPAAAAPAAANPMTPTASNPKPDDDATRGNLNISDEIRKACGLSDSEAYFAFDSANVRPQDQVILKKLATCFSTGALKGRVMRLVGHADPRGSSDYNLALGGKRADNVKGVIARQGLSADKIDTTSRGAMDATGTDEATWAKDRRVDVTAGQ